MRVLPFHTIPFFLSRALPGELGSQLRVFDVYYRTPPVVGWHVLGSPENPCPVVGFCAEGESASEGVTGFSVTQDSAEDKIVGFVVGECE